MHTGNARRLIRALAMALILVAAGHLGRMQAQVPPFTLAGWVVVPGGATQLGGPNLAADVTLGLPYAGGPMTGEAQSRRPVAASRAWTVAVKVSGTKATPPATVVGP